MFNKNKKADIVNDLNKRITAFAFKKNKRGIEIKIIGCFKIKNAPNQPYYSKGIITFNRKAYSVFDLQALSGLRPKEIGEDSCIVFLEPKKDFTDFSRAIIVDNVSEMLSMAQRKMEGLPVDTLFGRQNDSSRNLVPTPDFPDINKKPGHEEAALVENQCVKPKYAAHIK